MLVQQCHIFPKLGSLLLGLAMVFAVVGCKESELTQADLTNVDRLVAQKNGASMRQKSEALEWSKSAEEAAKLKKWDLASKMYGEVLLRNPSFALLKSMAEATARSSVRRETFSESIQAHRKMFRGSSETMRDALAFAEKFPKESPNQQVIELRNQLACLEAYEARSVEQCDLVIGALKQYANQR